MIVVESFAFALTAYDIAPEGTLSHRRTWAEKGFDTMVETAAERTGVVHTAPVDVPSG